MAQINTRIILRNDSSFNWLLNEDVVLMQGELGIEFLVDNSCKVKIGDGLSTWKNLPYFGGEQLISDEKTILVNDKIISLKGFADAENGSQLRKNANGELEWFVPTTEEEIGGLKISIANLDTEISNVKSDVTTLKEIITPSGEDAVPLLSRVESLEYAVNETGEGTVDSKIDSKINDFANKISDDGTVNTLKELVDYVAVHGSEVDAIFSDIADLKYLVGEEPVQNQITKAIEESGHITGATLNGTLLNVIDNQIEIPLGAGLKSSDEIEIADDGSMSIKSMSWDKISEGESELVLNGGSAIIE